ncbi:3-oxoacyl-ACP synthase III family protein [Sphaerisporangium aureirubrum]|uniref:3-oxoacyl-ACP synthase III family protein n=1 Tax=Sphaerisporangium aureirubrum TaxID=1544736 RepID=A0ABW1NW12_9ACTN
MDRPDIRILGVGTALPGPLIDNAELVRRFGLPEVWEQWIDTFVGTSSRHFALDLASGEVRYSLADLAEQAALRALAEAGVEADEVDLMVMGSATPDMLMPSTVTLVADRIGVDGISTYQLLSGCTGAIQALDVACQMLATGRHRTALVLGGDTCAKHLDPSIDLAELSLNMQVNAVLFGDAAGAAVLSTRDAPDAPVLRRVFTRLVGRGRAPGQTVDWYGWADRHSDREPVNEDFKAVEESAPVMAAEALQELLDDLDWKRTDLDYVLPPQLSGHMTRRVIEALDVPGAEVISCVAEIGNTANAIPFIQLERALPEMAMGDRAAGVSVEASKWIKAGYAVEMPDGSTGGV